MIFGQINQPCVDFHSVMEMIFACLPLLADPYIVSSCTCFICFVRSGLAYVLPLFLYEGIAETPQLSV